MRWPATLTWLSLPVFLLPAPSQTLGPCTVFPSDNIWNAPIDTLPLTENSAAYVNTIGARLPLHPDFGAGLWAGGPIGIPFVLVSNQSPVSVTFQYGDESDPGPYPIPLSAPIEGGSASSGDRHVLVVDQGSCVLYELFAAYPQSGGGWSAGSGAIFDLQSNRLRPVGWTSADAAGLPILPGLVRYDEVAAGAIWHAIRFTAPQTQQAYVWPARHYASSLTAAPYPPMGQRFRLRASYDISGFSASNQVILTALKKYGMMLADNGSSWYLSGAPDDRWNNDDLHALTQLTGADFEAVDVSRLMANPDSGQVLGASAAPLITSVVSGASFQADLAPGASVSVLGSNLAATTRAWTPSDIVNGRLPTELDGVSVTIGGSPAAISYVSPAQLNLQVPDVPAAGTAPLLVTAPAGSASAAIAIAPSAPALFLFDARGRRYAAAQHASDYSIAGSVGLYPGSTPLSPGEFVILYGTGFGPTNPSSLAGFMLTQPLPLASPVSASVGGVSASVIWAGLSAPGLNQVNLRIPENLPPGDAAVLIQTTDGQSTQANVFLTIE
jgi:uncharacterized protein (TIGR03437 family)